MHTKPFGVAVLLCSLAGLIGCSSHHAMPAGLSPNPAAQQTPWGTTRDGQAVTLYTLTSRTGVSVQLLNYGATIASIRTPDRNSQFADVVTGFDDIKGFESKANPYFGATIGRCANRIAKGQYSIDGNTYHAPINNAPNSLHGGDVGFDKVVWTSHIVADAKVPTVRFTHVSPAGDQGYPGTLKATVTFSLNNDNELQIDYEATTDAPTPVNLTNHTYFNLAGNGSGTILDHLVTIHATAYTPVDGDLIPTGEIRPVQGTPMDFTAPRPIGARIAQVPGGYDHNYVIDGGGHGKRVLAATVYDPKTGRVMDVESDQPGLQFYAGNFLDGSVTGKAGAVYQQHDALALETQHFPDSPNHANFPSVILRPGETYRTSTVYRFSAK